mgnify:CR=1 FL=1
MSVQLYDINGFIGDLATAKGLWDLHGAVMHTGGKEARGLFVLGTALVSDLLIRDLEKVTSSNPSIRATLVGLVALVKQADTIVIINNGLE